MNSCPQNLQKWLSGQNTRMQMDGHTTTTRSRWSQRGTNLRSWWSGKVSVQSLNTIHSAIASENYFIKCNEQWTACIITAKIAALQQPQQTVASPEDSGEGSIVPTLETPEEVAMETNEKEVEEEVTITDLDFPRSVDSLVVDSFALFLQSLDLLTKHMICLCGIVKI